MLDILYKDEWIVAINKPHRLIVHPSPIARDADTSAMEELRDQLGHYVYPAHRLDRKTGGVLLFGLTNEVKAMMDRIFAERQIQKIYYAIVRGFTEDEGVIDYALTNEKNKTQEAITNYKTVAQSEIAIPSGGHNTSRYSLVRVNPVHGRMHQIRKHFAHIHHPIIGDRPHGCNKQNKLFKEKWQMIDMLLHAHQIQFPHPINDSQLSIIAPIQQVFHDTMKLLKMDESLISS